ncbi:putative T7SS-secreted protein [Micromonospora sp. NPDC049044]|uniref:putative T7SS-secreted protein n=1 Tax=unclassified Micromonospora TaxID=2617518 RepID=UPI0033E2362D
MTALALASAPVPAAAGNTGWKDGCRAPGHPLHGESLSNCRHRHLLRRCDPLGGDQLALVYTGDNGMSLYGDPDELDRVAARLAARARELRDWRDDHNRRVETAHWVSTAADAYRQRARADSAEISRAADNLEQAARDLYAHAQEVRETLARIAAIERAAVDWFDRTSREIANQVQQVAGVLERVLTPPWDAWPYKPGLLPPPGDRQWLDVGKLLRSTGAI